MSGTDDRRDDDATRDPLWTRGTRTRGIVRTRGGAPRLGPEVARTAGPVRGGIPAEGSSHGPVLGTVRTRGKVDSTVSPKLSPKAPIGAKEIVERARDEVDRFHLTIVVLQNGEGGESWRVFVQEVTPLLQSRDAVWIVGDAPVVKADPDSVQVLDLQNRRATIHARTLVADVLCVNASSAAELQKLLAGWEYRVRALFVTCPESAAVTERLVGLRYLHEVP